MFLLVGLGNDQNNLLDSRHNIGFRVIDQLINHYNINTLKQKFHSYIAKGLLDNKKVILIKPKTMMNLSGFPVSEVVNFYKVSLDNIIVFHDDLDISLGEIKIKIGGGNAGHNGLKNIDSLIGKDYMRIRIGIGHPGSKDLVSNYVLGNFTKKENYVITSLIQNISKNINFILDRKKDVFLSKIRILN